MYREYRNDVMYKDMYLSAGGFPYSVEHMAGEGQPAQAVRPNIVRVYGACAVLLMCPSSNLWQRIHEGLWT